MAQDEIPRLFVTNGDGTVDCTWCGKTFNADDACPDGSDDPICQECAQGVVSEWASMSREEFWEQAKTNDPSATDEQVEAIWKDVQDKAAPHNSTLGDGEIEMIEMYIPENRKPNAKAIRECAEAIRYMREIGWPDETVPLLEKLWWTVRDDNGRVIGAPAPRNSTFGD